jgi:hypothetical protein
VDSKGVLWLQYRMVYVCVYGYLWSLFVGGL